MRVWYGVLFFCISSEAKNQLKIQSPLKLVMKKDYNSDIQIQHGNHKLASVSNPLTIERTQPNLNFSRVALSSWGVLGVVMLIANALQRLIPVALQPLIQKDLTPEQIVIYIVWTLYMIYVEGYKAFHLKFSPFVVRRSLTLSENPSSFLKCLLAGPYCMGLFSATKKRMIISWSLMVGVFALVKVVKLLPYPWRSIVDAGVVCGLSFGTISIIYHYILAMLGRVPSVDPDLPELDHDKHKE